MIEAEVLEVCRMADYKGALKVIISIPKGVELAKKHLTHALELLAAFLCLEQVV